MKKIKFLLFLFCLFVMPVMVFAAEDHKLTVNLAKCDPNAEDMSAAKCRAAYLNGTLETVSPDSSIEPGTSIMAAVHYEVGSSKDLAALQTKIFLDLDVAEPVYNSSTGALSKVNGNKFPVYYDEEEDKNVDVWNINASYSTSSDRFIFTAVANNLNEKFLPLTTDLDIAYVFIKIKDDASNGTTNLFTFDTSAESTNCNDKNSTVYPLVTENYSYNIQSKVSSNTALHTLTAIGNGVSYTSPDFVADDNTAKEYNIIVPNSVDTIDLQATATEGTVLAGTIGEKSLKVGNNEFTITVSAESGLQENYKVTIYRLNNDATLKSLSLTNDVNIGTFSSSTTSYTANVPYSVTNTTVSATATDSKATVTGNGIFDFTNYGSTPNVKEVIVKAENCDSKYASVEGNTCTSSTYTITVNRAAPSSNNYLSSLKVNGTLINGFNKETTSYTLEDIKDDTTSLNVEAIAEDEDNAIVTITGADSIKVGDNTITIKVTAEDGTSKTYTINVKKLSSDNSLKSLSINKGVISPAFESGTREYTVTMEKDVTTFNESMITAEANHEKAEIVYDSEKTINGDTTTEFTITVTAENGMAETYKLNVIKAKNNDATLKSLTVSEGTLNPGFESETTSYTVNVGNEVTSVTVNAEATDSNANVTITGGETLSVGNNTVTITVESEDGTPKTYTITVVRAGNSDATLKNIKIDGTLIDGFSSDKTEYILADITTDITSLNITAEANHSEADVTITGADSIKVGDNTITIKVTAEDGTPKAYTINVKKLSSDNSLKSLSINKGVISPAFESGTREYTVTMDEDVTTFNESMITAEANHEKAEIVYDTEKAINSETSTEFTITVTAENGVAETYKLNVIKAKNSDAKLSSLTVAEGTLSPNFAAVTTSYTVNVGNEVTSVTVNAEAADSKAEVTITGGDSLNVGNNTVKIVVKSESGDTKEYTITVVRAESSDATLKSIEVNDVLVTGFDSETLEYTLPKVEYEVTTLKVTAEANHSEATVIGTGDITLNTGNNLIELIVTAEDGTQKTYKLNVEREKNDDATLKSLRIGDYSLTPAFDKDTLEYTITVAETTEILQQSEVEAETTDLNAKIILDGDLTLSAEQDNYYNIKVVAENGEATNTYKVKVIKPKSSDSTLKSLSISGGTLNPAFESNVKTYDVVMPKDVTTFNESMITAEANHAKATITYSSEISINSETATEFVITVTAENGVAETYKLNVKVSSDESLKEITSTTHTIDGDNIKTVKLYETVLELKNNLDNENEYLEVWSADETTKIADDEKLATGMIVKLIQDNEEIDRKVVIIKGDTSGDGEIDLFDAVMILNHYLEKTALTNAYLEAAYANDDEFVDLFDAVMILNHYLGKTSLH